MTPDLLAEYPDEKSLLRALRTLRSDGFRALEVYTPFPVHGVDVAIEAKASRLPVLVFAVGASAAASAYALEWLLNAYLYPLDVGRRPPHFLVAYIPITFEMGVLFAAFTCFAGVLAFGRLLRLFHPVFEFEGFESASRDGFWIGIALEPGQPKAELDARLRATGAVRVSTRESAP